MATHIGKSLYYSTAAPATNDAAGFEALTWVKVPGYQGGIQFGLEHESIDKPDLEQGDTKTERGMASYPSSTATFRTRESTFGEAQQTFIGLVEDPTTIVPSIKIVLATGTDMTDGGKTPQAGDQVEYAQGYFHSPLDMEQTATNHEGFSVTFKQNERSVKDSEPVA